MRTVVVVRRGSLVSTTVMRPDTLRRVYKRPTLVCAAGLLTSLRVPAAIILSTRSGRQSTRTMRATLHRCRNSAIGVSGTLPAASNRSLLVLGKTLPLLSTRVMAHLRTRRATARTTLDVVATCGRSPGLVNCRQGDYAAVSRRLCYIGTKVILVRHSFLRRYNTRLTARSIRSLIGGTSTIKGGIAGFTMPFSTVHHVGAFRSL